MKWHAPFIKIGNTTVIQQPQIKLVYHLEILIKTCINTTHCYKYTDYWAKGTQYILNEFY